MVYFRRHFSRMLELQNLQRMNKKWEIIFYLLVLLVFFIVGQKANAPKILWTYQHDLDNVRAIEATIPQDSYVFDLAGYALKYKDPYYYCCLPYGQYWRVLWNKPSLSESLERTKTLYVVNNRIDTLPDEDRRYVETVYNKTILNGLILTK